MNKVIIINPSKCSGCRSCEVVCSLVKPGEAGIYKSRINTLRYPDEHFFLPRVCFQCETPYCIPACPMEAITKDSGSGVVKIDDEKCSGCGLCMEGCPFGAISMWDSIARKCDLCGGQPTCVKYCEREAIVYGEPQEISMDKKNVIAVIKKLGTFN